MAKLTLKNILNKKNETIAMIVSLIEKLHARVWIEDEKGIVLFGIAEESSRFEYPVTVGDDVMGSVKGDENANIIANLLIYSAQKESERKKLGAEVLNLYQEINLIYNFSEKLAQTIDAPSICAIALEEAGHVIRSDSGVVVLWDEKAKKIKIASSSGQLLVKDEILDDELGLLTKIILSGPSEILTDVSVLSGAGIILPEVTTIIYSALKVNKRVMGAIILSSKELIQYTAADLKLLTTLTLQASAAIESALLYEKNLQEAKEREEAMRIVYEVTGKFVPYEFIGSLGHKVITDVKLGDQVEKIVTVLFSDIRDYTTL
ncbi:MAG TPA: GAF domain-containing protein, partial [Chitinophagaceae bacterium]|nr:GAF domain-containing protein [Chitinophagaceae bacterium]